MDHWFQQSGLGHPRTHHNRTIPEAACSIQGNPRPPRKMLQCTVLGVTGGWLSLAVAGTCCAGVFSSFSRAFSPPLPFSPDRLVRRVSGPDRLGGRVGYVYLFFSLRDFGCWMLDLESMESRTVDLRTWKEDLLRLICAVLPYFCWSENN